MSASTRKQLISMTKAALDKLDLLEETLYNMEVASEGRQPAITKMTPIILQGVQALRELWIILREQL